MRMNHSLAAAGWALFVVALSGAAEATEPPPVPKYSLPWGLRPAMAGTLVRSDTAFAFHDGGTTVASTFLGGYALEPGTFGIYGRGAYVRVSPEEGDGAGAFGNPLLFALYTPKLTDTLRLAVFAGVALPFGQGGGNDPDVAKRAAVGAGVPARSSMDNALFAVNDAVPTVGFGLAHIADGLTLQAEATLLQLLRTRGDAVQPDSSKTNFTSGLHAGYFFGDVLSLGVEIRYQRWLSTPAFVSDELGNRDQLTLAAGPRANFRVGDSIVMRPGLSLALPLDDPMKKADYRVVQLDVPITF
jgi:hypothetical protein